LKLSTERPLLPITQGLATVLVAAGCASALAEGISPLSMRYAPGQGQWLASSAVSAERTDAELRSLPLNDKGVSRYGLISQTLDYGLTNSLTASVTEVYAHAFARNPLNPAEGRVGFRSPKFQLSAWAPLDSAWTLKGSTGLQFNPATSSGLNYGFVAGDVLLHPLPQQSLLLGWVYTAHKDIGSHSQSWRGEWEHSWGVHQVRLKYARSLLAGFDGTQGTFEPSRYTTWEVEWGRPLAPGFWGSLGYVTERNQFRWLQSQPPFQFNVSSQRHQQRLTASLKWLWL